MKSYSMVSVEQRPIIFSLVIMLTLANFQSKAQGRDTSTYKHVEAKKVYGRHRNAYGMFNYKYLRIALPTPAGSFGNPINNVPEAVGIFTMTDRPKNSYTGGLEWGAVRHFMGLRLGTEMLKLGINSGWAAQAFGGSTVTDNTNYQVEAGDTYLLRLGLGPQLSFKPHEDFRIGVYYRFGLAVAYSNYTNTQATQTATITRVDKVETSVTNAAYNGDVGIDLSWNKISLGFAYSIMTVQPSKNHLFSLGNNDYTTATAQQAAVAITIDPKIDFNRFVVSAGFAF